ncbi:helix-turn-helix domain-containing protein [Sphingobacterium psychroaquaticum]|uniref:DNA-binding transcriptional regulator, XRE-family HTH domain n=1 Tax=Sphingobacterium psychroaquaticum TaxID=561061 RepID=A0A1X7JUG2_9SPHI|nr:helix-turn-helix transcriptional regulator [Sphingobacterium psychroaquaticum]SMG31683.1 DNA-binding transcriptional regulator, XRE-family HTH domain [Sphingobacterium psychroaquaticum]
MSQEIEEIEKKQIGLRFREFRKSNGILQTDLEEGVPTTFVQISRIENGHRYPSVEILIYMAKTHNMDINYILTGQRHVKGNAK